MNVSVVQLPHDELKWGVTLQNYGDISLIIGIKQFFCLVLHLASEMYDIVVSSLQLAWYTDFEC